MGSDGGGNGLFSNVFIPSSQLVKHFLFKQLGIVTQNLCLSTFEIIRSGERIGKNNQGWLKAQAPTEQTPSAASVNNSCLQ